MADQTYSAHFDHPQPRDRAAHVGDAETRQRLQGLAHVLDNAVRLPGGYRIGIDGAIGLIPGLGDLAGAALSSYIVAEAHRLGTPRVVVLRMILNVLIESAVGAIPVIGDLFDFLWKANHRNVTLLEQHLDQPNRVQRQSGWVLVGVTAAVVAVAVLSVIAIVWAIGLLVSLF